MAPLSNYLPKAMLPLGKKPVLEHLVDEINSAGIEEVLIVTRAEYQTIFHYFKEWENVRCTIDDSSGGPGEALLAGEAFSAGEPFLIAFADAPFWGNGTERAAKELAELFGSHEAAAALSVYRVPTVESSSRGVVEFEGDVGPGSPGPVKAMREKPEREPSHGRIWASACRYMVGPEIFDALRSAERDKNGELQLTAALNVLLQEQKPVWGVPLPEGVKRHDTGNFEGYFKAFNDFSRGDNE